MTRLPPVSPGQILTGPLFSEPMRVETVLANGPASWVVGLVGAQSERFRKLATIDGDTVVWFWIGPHSEYDQLLRAL